MNHMNNISLSIKKRPHLFILGAGATKATIPNGDKFGRKSPVMNSFFNELGLEYLLNNIDLQTKSNNIETIYSELFEKPEYRDVVSKIEQDIISHYTNMQIPDEPTLYDYLILSLRKKDCIATFNWDPLLIQAYNRVNKITSNLPIMLFLHGCVEVGLCTKCNRFSPMSNKCCPICKNEYEMSKLLFPVKNKNYSQDLFILEQWNLFDNYIQQAGIITIWGYSAPESDVDARERMLKAFSRTFRKLDQIEIIDIADKNVLINNWNSFIEETNFHIEIHKSLMDSIVAEFPRRSMEGYTKRFIDGWWGESNIKLKECCSFVELKKLFTPLILNESRNNYNVI